LAVLIAVIAWPQGIPMSCQRTQEHVRSVKLTEKLRRRRHIGCVDIAYVSGVESWVLPAWVLPAWVLPAWVLLAITREKWSILGNKKMVHNFCFSHSITSHVYVPHYLHPLTHGPTFYYPHPHNLPSHLPPPTARAERTQRPTRCKSAPLRSPYHVTFSLSMLV